MPTPSLPHPGHVGPVQLAGQRAFFEAEPVGMDEVLDRAVAHVHPAFG